MGEDNLALMAREVLIALANAASNMIRAAAFLSPGFVANPIAAGTRAKGNAVRECCRLQRPQRARTSSRRHRSRPGKWLPLAGGTVGWRRNRWVLRGSMRQAGQ